ncbi:hypothetical protein GN330_22915 [Nitratireductor sp. CAU 1489]|uniref:Uncharacterized protein n=1 Tax=Nitratireductor arenosus TaxID=2682096 RepID=A0A844QQL9_9HYPH|nr:hypothetical protein [Nitratireductor arenosus]MVB00102.1 hypothetical protein [Nitratireductor arenosus]
MGNHDVGRGMAAAARVFWIAYGNGEVTQEVALKALDAMAKDYLGADAEFDDELHQETDLSELVAIAFSASEKSRAYLRGEDDDEETGYDEWYSTVYRPFCERYRFC